MFNLVFDPTKGAKDPDRGAALGPNMRANSLVAQPIAGFLLDRVRFWSQPLAPLALRELIKQNPASAQVRFPKSSFCCSALLGAVGFCTIALLLVQLMTGIANRNPFSLSAFPKACSLILTFVVPKALHTPMRVYKAAWGKRLIL